MRRWIFFLVTFLIFSALFLLASGEYGVPDQGTEAISEAATDINDESRFVVQVVDQEQNVLVATISARRVELLGDLVKLDAIPGVRLEDVEIEIYHSGGRRSVQVRAPAGEMLKEGSSPKGQPELKASLTGGVEVRFPDTGSSFTTEAVILELSGPKQTQKRLLITETADGRKCPVILEGVDPFARIEAAWAEADLSRGKEGEFRLFGPITAKADVGLAEGLSLFSGARIPDGETVEVESEGPMVIQGFMSSKGRPAVSARGRTMLIFDGRTKIRRGKGSPGQLEADRLSVEFFPGNAGAKTDGASDEKPKRGRVTVRTAEAAGNVEIRHGDFRLEAESVKWEATTGSAIATGAPVLRDAVRGREIRADRIAFDTRSNHVELEGQVAGWILVAPELDGMGKKSAGAGKWRFLVERLELRFEQDESTGQYLVSWGEARTKAGRPLVISDEGENTLITGDRLTFRHKTATLWGGEKQCRLRHGRSRFWANRIELRRETARVILSGQVRGDLHPGDMGKEEVAENQPESIKIVADELALEIRITEGSGESPAALPGGGEESTPLSRIRSILALGKRAPAKVEMGSLGIEGEELGWDLEGGILVAGGKKWRPAIWDDALHLRSGGTKAEKGGTIQARLEADSLEVRMKTGRALMRDSVRGKVTDHQGRVWNLGADAIELIFDPFDGETRVFLVRPEKGGDENRVEIRKVLGQGRGGKGLWIQGEPGRLEGGEAQWTLDDGMIRLSGSSGCRFQGVTEDGTAIDMRAARIILDTENQAVDLQGNVRVGIIPSDPSRDDEGVLERIRKAREALRKAGKDIRAPWRIGCENAHLEYVLPATAPDSEAHSLIRTFRADGGEGLVVIESDENDVKLTCTSVVYDMGEGSDGWLRMKGSESYPPRLEIGKEGGNVILAREIRADLKDRVVVFDKDVRIAFQSESMRELVPGANQEIPGLLWRLTAVKVTVRLADEMKGSGDFDLEAIGPLVFQAGSLQIEADSAVYDGAEEKLTFRGDPVWAQDGNASGTAKMVELFLRSDRIKVTEPRSWKIDPDTLKRIRGAKR
ncbi:MAG: hypothetical protein O7H41_20610 [Planctomycetota bacterium]|nr:hypothetical protein [Planctomycetota bacterium]